MTVQFCLVDDILTCMTLTDAHFIPSEVKRAVRERDDFMNTQLVPFFYARNIWEIFCRNQLITAITSLGPLSKPRLPLTSVVKQVAIMTIIHMTKRKAMT